MKRILRIRIFTASIAALSACLLVHSFNWVGINFIEWSKTPAITCLEWFLDYQWYSLVVPFIGIAVGCLFRKIKKRRFIFLIPELLYFFALAWTFLCLLVWSFQVDLSSSTILDRLGYFKMLQIDASQSGD